MENGDDERPRRKKRRVEVEDTIFWNFKTVEEFVSFLTKSTGSLWTFQYKGVGGY